MKNLISMLIAAFIIYAIGAGFNHSWIWAKWSWYWHNGICVAYTIMIIMWLTDISKPKSK